MASSKGLRARVSHALIVSAGIFTLALAFWGIETYQQSQADIAPTPVGTVTPTSGTAPLTVTAKYTGILPTGPVTTVNFDDIGDNVFVTDQYSGKHGLVIAGTNGGKPITAGVSLPGQRCSGGTEASSQPQYLSPRIGDLPGYGGATFTFATPVKTPGLTLVSVGKSTVTVTYAKADGAVIEKKTVGPNADDPAGACKQNPTKYEGSELVSKITVESNEPAGGEDGYGMDDLTYVAGASTDVQPVWTFGDGSSSQTGVSANYTYTRAGTYQVSVRLSDSDAVNAVATVTVNPATSDIPVTRVTTDKAKYALGETITFNFHNDGPGDVTLSNSAPYTISQNGQVVFQPIGLQVISTLKAQEKKTWTWDQKLTNGQAALAGTFAISVGYADNQGGKQATKTFDIESSTPTTAEVTLSTSKKEYAVGETVSFTLRNVGPATVQLPTTAPFRILKGSDVVFVPTAAVQVQTLAAGTDRSFTWDQKSTSGTTVTPGAYVVEANYTVGGAPGVKAAVFAISAPGAPVPTGKLSVNPSEGTAPLGVKVSVTELVGKAFVDFGDGVITEVAQNATLDHTYSIPGTYTLTLVDQASGKVLASAAVKVSATPIVTSTTPSDDGKGKGAPSVLASTGTNLLLILLIAALLSGLISYFIIRRPFHGGSN